MGAPSVDLLALLRPSEVVVAVAGHKFTLNARTAAEWIGAIATDFDELAGIMPGLIADEDLDLMERIMEDHPDFHERWIHCARTALGRAGGRDWWWTLHLCQEALGTWLYINGLLLRQGVDSKKMGLPDWLDACYTLYWQNASEEDKIKLDMRLSMRPKGVAVRQSSSQVDKMLADFAAD